MPSSIMELRQMVCTTVLKRCSTYKLEPGVIY